MALTFETTINMTDYIGMPAPSYTNSMMLANEPKGDINYFYIYNGVTGDKNATHADYSSLIWTGGHSSLTSQAVSRVGVKHFPHLGAMAFYTLLYEERSLLLCPVFIQTTRYKRPTLTITQGATTVTFTMQSPEDITYKCWRVVMRNGDTAFEYVSYENTLTVTNPYISGTYDCYCIGYIDEGQSVSDDSAHTTITIVGSGEDPLKKFQFYTKDEIDAMLGSISSLLDTLNGEVI